MSVELSDAEVEMVWCVQDAFHGKFKQEEYEMKSFWDTDFPANLFGVNSPEIQERSSLEDDTTEAAFPVFAHACYLCEATPSGQGYTF